MQSLEFYKQLFGCQAIFNFDNNECTELNFKKKRVSLKKPLSKITIAINELNELNVHELVSFIENLTQNNTIDKILIASNTLINVLPSYAQKSEKLLILRTKTKEYHLPRTEISYNN